MDNQRISSHYSTYLKFDENDYDICNCLNTQQKDVLNYKTPFRQKTFWDLICTYYIITLNGFKEILRNYWIMKTFYILSLLFCWFTSFRRNCLIVSYTRWELTENQSMKIRKTTLRDSITYSNITVLHYIISCKGGQW